MEWKALADKGQYIQPYEAEMKEYKPKLEEYASSGKKDAWKRDPAKPKAPMTTFLRYAADFRSKHPDMKTTEASKAAGAAWKTATAMERASYGQIYASEKKGYDEALKAYKASGKEEAWKERVGIKAMEDKKSKLKKKEAIKKEKAKVAAATKKRTAAESLAKKKKAAEALAEKKKATLAAKKKKAAEAAAKKKKVAALMKKKKAAAAAAAKKKKIEALAKKKEKAADARKKKALAAAKKKAAAAERRKESSW